MINKYIKQLEDLLNISIEIQISLKGKFEKIESYNLVYVKNSEGSIFKIISNNTIISHFKLIQMIGCCGICVSTGVYVHNEYRNKGVNTILNNFRIDIAKELGYGLLLCTDVSNNTAEVKTLDKNGWKHIYNFKNPRTSNKINISIKELNNDF